METVTEYRNASADVDGEIKHTNVLKLANILANCPYKY